MRLDEAQSWIGKVVRCKMIDDVQVNGSPIDRRLYLMCEGERVMNVTNLKPSDVPLGMPVNTAARGPRAPR